MLSTTLSTTHSWRRSKMYLLYWLTQELLKMMRSALENQVAQISSIPEHLDFLSESNMEETKRYDNYDRVMDITLEMLKTVIECTLYENATLTKFADLIGTLTQCALYHCLQHLQ